MRTEQSDYFDVSGYDCADCRDTGLANDHGWRRVYCTCEAGQQAREADEAEEEEAADETARVAPEDDSWSEEGAWR